MDGGNRIERERDRHVHAHVAQLFPPDEYPLLVVGRAVFLLSFTTIIDAKEFVFGLELHRNHIKTLTPSTQMDL